MGNSNSGRWGDTRKATTGSYLRLDIRYLCGKGCFRPGVSGNGSLSWTRNGNPAGRIGYSFLLDEITLHYHYRDENIHQAITISRTPCHFGGHMVWFLCPRCTRRVNALYAGNRFYCRKCHSLSYNSQQEGYLDRTMRKERKLRARIGGSENLVEPIPFRPKGMHWKTYWRTREKVARISRGSASIMWKMMGCSQP